MKVLGIKYRTSGRTASALNHFSGLFFCLFFETGSHTVGQAVMNSDEPGLASSSQ